MNNRRKLDPPALVEQPAALSSYLEALLQEVPETLNESRQPDAAPVQEIPQPAVEAAAAPPTKESAAAVEPPPWGRQTFQCLVFKVAGLSLAVPLVKLNGVIPWQEVTSMPNRSALFLGLLRHQGRSVKVMDTALVVMPERLQSVAAEDRVHHIILMDDGRWGLACDDIGEVLTLESSDVRWRTAEGRRPWLAGTVLQHLCALLDADALVHLLATGR